MRVQEHSHVNRISKCVKHMEGWDKDDKEDFSFCFADAARRNVFSNCASLKLLGFVEEYRRAQRRTFLALARSKRTICSSKQ
jgi:hypothetical protein